MASELAVIPIVFNKSKDPGDTFLKALVGTVLPSFVAARSLAASVASLVFSGRSVRAEPANPPGTLLT